MVCYAIRPAAHPAHFAHRAPGPSGLPHTWPIWPAAHLAHLARPAPGPFGPQPYRPIWPATCPAHSASHPTGTFSPLSTLKDGNSEPSLPYYSQMELEVWLKGWWEGSWVWREGGRVLQERGRVWREGGREGAEWVGRERSEPSQEAVNGAPVGRRLTWGFQRGRSGASIFNS